MKKSVVVIMVVLLSIAIGTVQSQTPQTKKETKSERKALRKLEGSKVSDIAKTHFYKDFGNIPNVQWKRSINLDEANFIKDGQKMIAYYDYDANLVGTTSIKTFTDLPADGQKEIKAKYKEYSVGPVILFNDNEAKDTDMILYDLQFDDTDNYFVELTKGNSKIVVTVNDEGNVSFFKQL